MKQLLILSGKGGTGKTTVASALIKLSGANVFADCDVDAPNLHILAALNSEPEMDNYYGLKKAVIDRDKCIGCGTCLDNCRFGAVNKDENGYSINSFACEGCAVCQATCPVEAVTMQAEKAGDLMLYREGRKVFSTARLRMGSGTSGMLVSDVKKRMKNAVDDETEKLAIIDGSPGIGCPVIASMSGVDMVLVVAEPSAAGMSDMERVILTAKKFGVRVAVCVNKADTNPDKTEKIKEYCENEELFFAGAIPYDKKAVEAINNGRTIVDIDCPSGEAVRSIYNNVIREIVPELEA